MITLSAGNRRVVGSDLNVGLFPEDATGDEGGVTKKMADSVSELGAIRRLRW